MKILSLLTGRGIISLGLILSMFFISGCGAKNGAASNGVGSEAAKPAVGPPQSLTSTDGKTQLTVPGNWKVENDLNSDAKLQLTNRENEEALLLFSENKEDLQAAGIALGAYAEEGYKPLMARLTAAKMTGPNKITIQGSPAIQYQLEGEADKSQDKSNIFKGKLIYLYTVIESPKQYHQLVSWTTAARFSQNRAELQQLTESLKELNTK